MKKITGILAALLFSTNLFAVSSASAAPQKANTPEPTTRNDAVIFKIHDIDPVSKEGIVTGCDFTVTLYNRTAVNFRNFTLNLNWKDLVDERFQFDTYVKSILGDKAPQQEAELLGEQNVSKPLSTALTVNAFGANKQISIRSHVDNEKCYLLLSQANYTVTPCDIARSADPASRSIGGSDGKECTSLFQLVDTSNPEYFGEFKNISATEIATQNQQLHSKELTDIDVVISKIVENLGSLSKSSTDIN
ncbi:MAG: hypothetical protein NC218_03005 [Acetobacter sp.]|nr:hypothetical protein [Acetobacter sp.]